MRILSRLSFISLRSEDSKPTEVEEVVRPQSRRAFRPKKPASMLETLPNPTQIVQPSIRKRSESCSTAEPVIHEDYILPSLSSQDGPWPPHRASSTSQPGSSSSLPPTSGPTSTPASTDHKGSISTSLPAYDTSVTGQLPPYEAVGHQSPQDTSAMVRGVGSGGSSEEEDQGKRKYPPDLLQLSHMYENRRVTVLGGVRSQSSLSDSRVLLKQRPRSVIPRPASEAGMLSVKPRKLEPLERKPVVPEANCRIRIPDQKGLGGLHLSVNYKKTSWNNGKDPLIKVLPEDDGNLEDEPTSEKDESQPNIVHQNIKEASNEHQNINITTNEHQNSN